MRKSDAKVLELYIDPEWGFAGIAVKMVLKEPRFWKMERRGTRAKVFFVKEKS